MTIFAADFTQPLWARRAPRALLGCVALASAMTLSGCGGGTQAEKFAPTTLVVFGDESSAFASLPIGSGEIKGGKYGVNNVVIAKGSDWPLLTGTPSAPNVSVAGLPAGASLIWDDRSDYPSSTSTPVGTEVGTALLNPSSTSVSRTFNIDVTYTLPPATTPTLLPGALTKFQYVYQCAENRLWTQIVANAYGLGFGDDCPAEGHTGAYSYAQAGQKVADIPAQVTAAAARLGSRTLVTILAGQNDVIASYQAAVTAGLTDAAKSQAIADMLAKGKELGRIINGITNTGARVAYLTLPALQYSPYVRATPANTEFMKNLVKSFNKGLTGSEGVIDNGHKVAISDAYDLIAGNEVDSGMALAPSNYNLTNATTAWCQPSQSHKPNGDVVTAANDLDPAFALYCTSQSGPPDLTTNTVGSAYLYLWADATHLSPSGQAAIGNLVYNRVTTNPL